MSVRTTTSTQEGFRLLVSIYFSRADRVAMCCTGGGQEKNGSTFSGHDQVLTVSAKSGSLREEKGREVQSGHNQGSVWIRDFVSTYSPRVNFSTTEVVPTYYNLLHCIRWNFAHGACTKEYRFK